MVASNVNKHRKIFEKFTTLCRTVSSFSDCQKHEYITVKTLQGDEEMKTLQCLHFLSITHGFIILLIWFLRALDFISYPIPTPSYYRVNNVFINPFHMFLYKLSRKIWSMEQWHRFITYTILVLAVNKQWTNNFAVAKYCSKSMFQFILNSNWEPSYS